MLGRAHLGIEPLQAWLGLGRVLSTVVLGEVLLVVRPSATPVAASLVLTALGWLVTCAGFTGLFIVGHECGHLAFSRSKRVNWVVGHLCMSPIVTAFHNWRLSHNHHHAFAQLRGQDTDWPETMLTVEEYGRASVGARLRARLGHGSIVGLLIGFWVGVIRRTFMRALYPQVKLTPRTRRELWLSNAAMLATSGAIMGGLWLARGPWEMVRLYLVPVYLGSVVGALFTYLHHSAEDSIVFDAGAWTPLRGQVVGTFDVRFPRWFERLFLHINRHVPHHIAPRIPWYRLPHATACLEREYPSLLESRSFSLRYLARALSAPLLEPIGGGMYRAGPVPATEEDLRPIESE
jgi:omega-6 fatty acid desaturase (delta-12 desaturase)